MSSSLRTSLFFYIYVLKRVVVAVEDLEIWLHFLLSVEAISLCPKEDVGETASVNSDYIRVVFSFLCFTSIWIWGLLQIRTRCSSVFCSQVWFAHVCGHAQLSLPLNGCHLQIEVFPKCLMCHLNGISRYLNVQCLVMVMEALRQWLFSTTLDSKSS